MSQSLDLSGETFGRLKILSFDRTVVKNGHYIRYWNCECECGKIKPIRQLLLRSGKTKSCGCYRVDVGRKLFKGCGSLSASYWKRVIKGCIKRNININITVEEAWKIFINQRGKCSLTGLDITLKPIAKERSQATASLDRIDSSKGYVEGNVQWVHKDINLMKRDYDEVYFIELCKLVTKHRPLQETEP